MIRSLLTSSAGVAALLLAVTARADDPPAPAIVPPVFYPSSNDRPPPPTRKVWYGWQTLAVDGLSVVVGLGASRADGNLGAGVALGGYLFGAPMVHWAHGSVGKAFGSLGLRVALPSVLGLVGFAAVASDHGVKNSNDFHDAISMFLQTAVSGAAIAVAFDSAFLARERRPVDDLPDPWKTAAAPRGLFVPGSLSPILQPTKGGAGAEFITGGVIGISAALY